MLKSLFRKHSAPSPGDTLYAAVAAQARQPAFYTVLGVADRIDARFELYTLHALLLILRLRDEDAGEDGKGVAAAQSLFDAYVSALDNVLRELGVGDVSMARKMRTLGEALYGRMTAYESPLRSGDAATLSAGLARNVFESEDAERGAALARYALAAREALAAQSFAAVLKPSWPEIAA
ncbi:ubiquinol-cytochrome C chaperone family protein [Brevundimonas goettingensis]|uniref:Ubiquinol-cytochrome C chaperone n=1 Tax=Brevundimonas goettingensis TaxID=2774190 RepID=A0A975GZR2_9CAUL|nr:ubiquinol-cytochrome C chaperone family protein [Brevundimonas goettingensis]QTC92905.1 ubiquinol-cytochrome C chaperone [Brevundimonas goettingensis]